MTKAKHSVKNRNLSLRRKVIIYYYRIILLLKLSVIVCLCLLLFTDLFKSFTDRVWNAFYQESAKYGLVLQKVVIEGQNNTPYRDILDKIGGDTGTPILSIALGEVKEALEGHMWVKSAIVERQLPSTLYIAIKERSPIAIWQFKQKLYIIDAEGNRISRYENNNFSNLLQVVGQEANIYAKNLIDDLNIHPDLATKIKSAVRFGNRRWDLHLEQEITVKMPENNFNKAYNYIQSLDKKQQLFDQDYKMLDLRDSKKYYLEKR